jgi:rhamnosyltransferase
MLPPVPDKPRASIIIRAYNEAKHLPQLLERLAAQSLRDFEVILVDSGSTDQTAAIAHLAGARIAHIDKNEFTFGRSLNRGCQAARGDILVFISGHCYPMHRGWLAQLLRPFDDPAIGLAYGKQRGGPTTKWSEHRHFRKTFPDRSAIPQEGFFCNNANCAIRRDLWQKRPFDEALTGLEDLDWAKWLVAAGRHTAYSAAAGVYHLHDETWPQVFRRYEREAIALKQIMPDLTFSFLDFLRLFLYSTWLDLKAAAGKRRALRELRGIIAFRFMQYWGTCRGTNYRKVLTRQLKEKFFYPHK